MDLPALNTNFPLKLYKCNGGGNQQWYLDQTGRIRSALDEDQCAFVSAKVKEVYVQKCDFLDDHQAWIISEDGRYQSKAFPDKVIAVSECSVDPKNTLKLQDVNACSTAHRWFMSSTPPPPPRKSQAEDAAPQEENGDGSPRDEDYNNFNGKLVNRGWTLVWFTPGEFMTAPELLLPKLSPGKLFAPSVCHAMFIDSFALTTTPVTEDLLFLTDHMYQDVLPSRRDSIRLSNGKKKYFQLAPEPERHALAVVSPMRLPEEDEKGKIPLKNIVSKMVEDMGGDSNHEEPPEITAQRTFYEKTSSYVNKVDLRSIYEPIYQFRMNHWIKSRWIVHDLRHEEAKNFRCEWYKEQTDWDSDVDQLGFAYVMAKRGLRRMIGRDEPDERAKLHIPPEPPEIDDLTDKKEWFEILNARTGWVKDGELNDGSEEVIPQDVYDGPRYFIRIMSNRAMWYRRRDWNKRHASSLLRKFQ